MQPRRCNQGDATEVAASQRVMGRKKRNFAVKMGRNLIDERRIAPRGLDKGSWDHEFMGLEEASSEPRLKEVG